jgi:hypothetical protein
VQGDLLGESLPGVSQAEAIFIDIDHASAESFRLP